MRRIRKEEKSKDIKDRKVYIPMTFASMISHLSYKYLREETKN